MDGTLLQLLYSTTQRPLRDCATIAATDDDVLRGGKITHLKVIQPFVLPAHGLNVFCEETMTIKLQ